MFSWADDNFDALNQSGIFTEPTEAMIRKAFSERSVCFGYAGIDAPGTAMGMIACAISDRTLTDSLNRFPVQSNLEPLVGCVDVLL